jgi:hypothetical protein
MPERIQRTKHQHLSENAVYVGPRTMWANPYSLRLGEAGEPTGARALIRPGHLPVAASDAQSGSNEGPDCPSKGTP